MFSKNLVGMLLILFLPLSFLFYFFLLLLPYVCWENVNVCVNCFVIFFVFFFKDWPLYVQNIKMDECDLL